MKILKSSLLALIVSGCGGGLPVDKPDESETETPAGAPAGGAGGGTGSSPAPAGSPGIQYENELDNPAPYFVWKDREGNIAAYGEILYYREESTGYFYRMDPETGQLLGEEGGTGMLYHSNADCTGTAYVNVRPRMAELYRVNPVGDPNTFTWLVRGDSVVASRVTTQSFSWWWSGAGNGTATTCYAFTNSGATLTPVSQLTTITALPSPNFAPPLRQELIQ